MFYNTILFPVIIYSVSLSMETGEGMGGGLSCVLSGVLNCVLGCVLISMVSCGTGCWDRRGKSS